MRVHARDCDRCLHVSLAHFTMPCTCLAVAVKFDIKLGQCTTFELQQASIPIGFCADSYSFVLSTPKYVSGRQLHT